MRVLTACWYITKLPSGCVGCVYLQHVGTSQNSHLGVWGKCTYSMLVHHKTPIWVCGVRVLTACWYITKLPSGCVGCVYLQHVGTSQNSHLGVWGACTYSMLVHHKTPIWVCGVSVLTACWYITKLPSGCVGCVYLQHVGTSQNSHLGVWGACTYSMLVHHKTPIWVCGVSVLTACWYITKLPSGCVGCVYLQHVGTSQNSHLGVWGACTYSMLVHHKTPIWVCGVRVLTACWYITKLPSGCVE